MSVELRLGPLLRHVTDTAATVWVETSAPGEVTVVAGTPGAGREEITATAGTFTVHGHHYALCDLDGLSPGSAEPYRVLLDRTQVWPPPDSPHPPSLIRTQDPSAPTRVVFGSCHIPADHTPQANARHGVDMLRAYAVRLAERRSSLGARPGGAVEEGPAAEPDLLMLIGDQVYADELQPKMLAFLRDHRGGTGSGQEAEPPTDEVVFFDEYAELYRQAWSDPDIRWLLSTVPSLMLFDDHDIRDDWNTSGTWRRQMETNPWWRPRITAGLGAYWLYQHLGNLSPTQRAADPLFDRVAKEEGDAAPVVDEFAWTAHREPTSYHWSYRYDVGRSRFLMVDTRCGRIVEDDAQRSMLGPEGTEWLEGQITGDVDHLVLASTLPFLLPPGIHYLEAWNEAVCAGRWGQWARGFSERLRQAVDLEHWSAFRRSFGAVSQALIDTAAGRRGTPPASVLLLGGDVHFSYLARARPRADSGAAGPITQLVSSPSRNPPSAMLHAATWLATRRVNALGTWLLARLAGVGTPALRWRLDDGPRYGNTLATLVLDGRVAEVTWEHARAVGSSGAERTERPVVRELMRHRLASG